MMTSRQRMLAAINREKPDRLPVTTHHVMPYFLKKYENGISIREFFDKYGFDAILWTQTHKPDITKGQYFDPNQRLNPDGGVGFLEARRIVDDDWRITREELPDKRYFTERYTIHTPSGNLSMVLQSNDYTTWVGENLIKEKKDIEILQKHMTAPLCDVEAVNKEAEAFGERGLVRSHIVGFDLFGQGGTWQDACCVFGTENLIMETFDDPEWVHELLDIFMRRKVYYTKSLKGAKYDILELGGGHASTNVISPKIFQEFVAPYDAKIVKTAHEAGQRIVYHLCGWLMAVLDDVVSMNVDAIETFTPRDMGGDTDLKRAKERVGGKVCMIGGFDQGHYLMNNTPNNVRALVHRCFEEAGEGGGYILSPSDHFFDAEDELIQAMVDAAKECIY